MAGRPKGTWVFRDGHFNQREKAVIASVLQEPNLSAVNRAKALNIPLSTVQRLQYALERYIYKTTQIDPLTTTVKQARVWVECKVGLDTSGKWLLRVSNVTALQYATIDTEMGFWVDIAYLDTRDLLVTVELLRMAEHVRSVKHLTFLHGRYTQTDTNWPDIVNKLRSLTNIEVKDE